MTMRDRLEAPARGAPRSAVLTAGPGGDVVMASPGAVVPAPVASAWDAVVGESELMSDVREFIETTAANPEMRSATFLRAMDRFRDELGKIPETAPLDSPVVISLSDALTLARVLLQKLR